MDICLNWPFVLCSSWLQSPKCSLHRLCLARLFLTITFSGQLPKLSLMDLVSSSSLLLAHKVCLHHPAHHTFFCLGVLRVPSGAEFHLSSVMICSVRLFFIGFLPSSVSIPSLYCCFLASLLKEIMCPPILFSRVLWGNSNQTSVSPKIILFSLLLLAFFLNHIIDAWWTVLVNSQYKRPKLSTWKISNLRL